MINQEKVGHGGHPRINTTDSTAFPAVKSRMDRNVYLVSQSIPTSFHVSNPLGFLAMPMEDEAPMNDGNGSAVGVGRTEMQC